jgi:glycosyltransferase involved in cell wall biosynthesis
MHNIQPVISIVTATYNAESHLQNLIKSIIPQKTERVELIIIDGKSKDGTIGIIEDNNEFIDYWISEPDTGIYDAWNKGINIARGKWIMFLGADDVLKENSLSKLMFSLKNIKTANEIDLISSKVEMINDQRHITRVKGWPWCWPNFLFEMTIAHPGALHSRKLFEKYGIFNVKYKITGDYELLLRAKSKLKTYFIDEVIVQMSEGGASDSIKAIKEQRRASIKTGGANSILAYLNFSGILIKYIIKKVFRKVGLNLYLKK